KEVVRAASRVVALKGAINLRRRSLIERIIGLDGCESLRRRRVAPRLELIGLKHDLRGRHVALTRAVQNHGGDRSLTFWRLGLSLTDNSPDQRVAVVCEVDLLALGARTRRLLLTNNRIAVPRIRIALRGRRLRAG